MTRTMSSSKVPPTTISMVVQEKVIHLQNKRSDHHPVWDLKFKMTGRKKILNKGIKMVMRSSLYNLLSQEVDQSLVVLRSPSELKVLKTLLTSSQTPNADLVEMPKLLKQTTSDAQRDQLLSTNLKKLKLKITHAYYAKIPQPIQDTKLLQWVCLSQVNSMTFIHLFHIDITNHLMCPTSIQDTDQKMVIPLFKSGVTISLILEMISDAISVLDLPRLCM